MTMTYAEVLKQARGQMGACKACPVCDGRACKNMIPGPGAKGVGDVAIRNYNAWKDIRINMDTLCENGDVDTTLSIFGQEFRIPVFAGPVGAVQMHYSDKHDDLSYNDILVRACKKSGIVAMTGDGIVKEVMPAACKAIAKCDGFGIPTVKPWDADTVARKMNLVRVAGAFAVAMDVDAAGLPFLKNCNPPAGSKTVEELTQIIEDAKLPFIVKGIMTVRGALKAIEAGADAIVVSNHGGRVLDQTPATAEVLPAIVEAVQGKCKILVDGGIRDGVDIFKALALGADGVIIARPFVQAVYGAEDEGVEALVSKLEGELKDTMAMCGAHNLSEIRKSMIFVKK